MTSLPPCSAASAVQAHPAYLLVPFVTIASLVVVAAVSTSNGDLNKTVGDVAPEAGPSRSAVVLLFAEVWQILKTHVLFGQHSRQELLHGMRALRSLAVTQRPAVLLLLSIAYLTLQTFSIPGTIFINALLGAVLQPATLPAVALCVLLGTMGAVCCFSLSKGIGAALVAALDRRLLRGKGVARLTQEAARHLEDGDLMGYLLFLRLTPVLPNWLINLATPLTATPLWMFALATAIGITPQTFLAVRFGALLMAPGGGATSTGSYNTTLESAPAEPVQMMSVGDTMMIAAAGVAVLGGQRLYARRFSNIAAAGKGEEPIPEGEVPANNTAERQ